MKQIIILEEHEVRTLQRGKTLVLSTPGGEVGVQFSRNGNGAGAALRCQTCGATSGIHGKPFASLASLAAHRRTAHAGRKR